METRNILSENVGKFNILYISWWQAPTLLASYLDWFSAVSLFNVDKSDELKEYFLFLLQIWYANLKAYKSYNNWNILCWIVRNCRNKF